MSHRSPAGALLFNLLLAPWAGAAPESYNIAPPGAWVVEVDPEVGASVPAREVEGGVHELLRDRQVRVEHGTVEAYERVVRGVLSSAGVGEVAELSVTFDPAYEQLALHHVRILRDGVVRELLSPEAIRVVQREEELERRIYDGRLSAILFMEDVRPGDVVDYAFTRTGSNPVLGGTFVAGVDLAYSFPVHRRHCRILWLSDGELRIREHGLQKSVQREDAPGGTVYTWDLRDVPAVHVEDDAPVWHDPWPWAQLSQFATWADVALLASDLFAIGLPSPVIEEVVAPWRGLAAEQQALAAIRFVQDEIRYLGIETGAGSHRPNRAEDVLSRRYGDCKDKALLLASMIRQMGIEAYPALVNTRARRGLDVWLPSLFAFDHVIVRVDLPGGPVWVDATAAHQGGGAAALLPPPFERALVVRPSSAGLTEIPMAAPEPQPMFLVEESFVTTSFDLPSTLRVVTTYRSHEANRMRGEMAGASEERRSRMYRDFYGQLYPGAEPACVPTFRDRREENVLEVEESYQVPDLWRNGRFTADGWAVREQLRRPVAVGRIMPLGVRHPRHVVHRIHLDLPEPFDVTGGGEHLEDRAVEYRSEARAEGRRIELSYSYRTKADSLVAEEVVPHDALIVKATDDAAFVLSRGSKAVRGDALTPGHAWAISASLIGSLLGLAAMARTVRWGRDVVRRRRLRRFTTFAPGATAFTAIPVCDEGGISTALARVPCRCGVRSVPEISRENVRFAEKRMTVVTRACGACGRRHDVYFDVGGAATPHHV